MRWELGVYTEQIYTDCIAREGGGSYIYICIYIKTCIYMYIYIYIYIYKTESHIYV